MCKASTGDTVLVPRFQTPNHRERGIYQVAFGVVLRLPGELYETARFHQSDWWAGHYSASVRVGKDRRRTFRRLVVITKDREKAS